MQRIVPTREQKAHERRVKAQPEPEYSRLGSNGLAERKFTLQRKHLNDLLFDRDKMYTSNLEV